MQLFPSSESVPPARGDEITARANSRDQDRCAPTSPRLSTGRRTFLPISADFHGSDKTVTGSRAACCVLDGSHGESLSPFKPCCLAPLDHNTIEPSEGLRPREGQRERNPIKHKDGVILYFSIFQLVQSTFVAIKNVWEKKGGTNIYFS